jgi:hypothetical protein
VTSSASRAQGAFGEVLVPAFQAKDGVALDARTLPQASARSDDGSGATRAWMIDAAGGTGIAGTSKTYDALGRAASVRGCEGVR